MKLPEIPTDPKTLNQLSKTELVQLIISQQQIIEQLKQEIDLLKTIPSPNEELNFGAKPRGLL